MRALSIPLTAVEELLGPGTVWRSAPPTPSKFRFSRPVHTFVGGRSFTEASKPSDVAVWSFRAEQEWEGVVADIDSETFVAQLFDVTAGSKVANEEAEFLLSDVSADDFGLLRVGAVFRWSVGYNRTPAGTRQRASQLHFRRMPAWHRRELKQSRLRAESLSTFFADEN